MIYIYRFLLLIVFAVLAGPLYAITVNIMIALDIFQSGEVNFTMGEEMTRKAALIWMGSLLIGATGIFVKTKNFYFFSVPLIAPSLFALMYAPSL